MVTEVSRKLLKFRRSVLQVLIGYIRVQLALILLLLPLGLAANYFGYMQYTNPNIILLCMILLTCTSAIYYLRLFLDEVYVLTAGRIIRYYKLFTPLPHKESFSYTDIEDITVSYKGIGRILDYGTITISDKYGNKIILAEVSSAERTVSLIRSLISMPAEKRSDLLVEQRYRKSRFDKSKRREHKTLHVIQDHFNKTA